MDINKRESQARYREQLEAQIRARESVSNYKVGERTPPAAVRRDPSTNREAVEVEGKLHFMQDSSSAYHAIESPPLPLTSGFPMFGRRANHQHAMHHQAYHHHDEDPYIPSSSHHGSHRTSWSGANLETPSISAPPNTPSFVHTYYHPITKPAAPAPALDPHREAQQKYRLALETQMKEKQKESSRLGGTGSGPLGTSSPVLLKFLQGKGWVPTKR